MLLQGVAFPKGSDGWSRHQASTLLRAMAEMFQRADIPALVELFAEDCTIRYGAAAEQHGRVPLRRVLTGLVERRRELRMQKTCIAIDRDKLVIRSEESWKEGEANTPMTETGTTPLETPMANPVDREEDAPHKRADTLEISKSE